MKICVFGETKKFDINLYRTLCLRILRECYGIGDIIVIPHTFDPQGKGRLLKQVFIEIDSISEFDKNIDIIFIFADSDNYTYKRQIKYIYKLAEDSKTIYPLNSLIVACPQVEIEAWLISDIENINRITERDYPKFNRAETIVNPKMEFENIWRENSSFERYEFFGLKVIGTINIDTLYKKSSAFQYFHKNLHDLLTELMPQNHHRGHILF